MAYVMSIMRITHICNFIFTKQISSTKIAKIAFHEKILPMRYNYAHARNTHFMIFCIQLLQLNINPNHQLRSMYDGISCTTVAILATYYELAILRMLLDHILYELQLSQNT